jgi:DNA helicase-2/ATP-dependent DNA helicase PcrA
MISHAAESLKLKLDTASLRDTAAEIEWRKVSRMSIDQYAGAKRSLPPTLTIEKVVDLQRAYESVKDERRQLDFEDVLLVAAGMIESEPRVAQQVQEQYRFFVVDEYQDVSPLQQELLDLWLGDRNDVCVVGDASQTIYTFAGASPNYLLGFTSEHDEATVIRLEQNYRSTPAIVDAANRVMQGRVGALELRAADGAPSGPVPSVSEYPNDRAEARAIADAIAAEIESGTRPENIAVLYRINSQSAPLETAFGDAGVPFAIRGATRFFDLREVKQAIMMLKGASISIVGEPLFKTVSDVLRSLGWTQDPPEGRGAVRDRWESLNAILGLAEDSPPETSLKDFVAELLERQAGGHEPTMSAVTLATLHSAKGLEWDSVFIAGASEGLLPIGYAMNSRGDETAIDEERRLFYVGITRARRRLRVSWAGPGREPSRFLAALR